MGNKFMSFNFTFIVICTKKFYSQYFNEFKYIIVIYLLFI